MDQERLDAFLKDLVAVEKRAIVSGSMSSTVRLREIEKLVDAWFQEIESDETQAD